MTLVIPIYLINCVEMHFVSNIRIPFFPELKNSKVDVTSTHGGKRISKTILDSRNVVQLNEEHGIFLFLISIIPDAIQ